MSDERGEDYWRALIHEYAKREAAHAVLIRQLRALPRITWTHQCGYSVDFLAADAVVALLDPPAWTEPCREP